MPFSGGTAGAHGDAMHQDDAKRDTALGLAGLDAAGDVLAPGANVVLTRNGSDEMELHERTSGEVFARWVRVGVDDYTQWLHVGTVPVEVLHTAMKDVANGVAGLDAAGDLLVPGSELHLTRTGADWTFIKERTSGEVILQFKRWGADDYTPSVLNSGAPSPIQLANMKDVVNGIAGLDANGKIQNSAMAGLLKLYTIGDASLHTHTGVVNTDINSYVKMKTIAVDTLYATPSTIRIKFDLYRVGISRNVYGRIYKNGGAVGIERITNSDTPQTYTEDISFAEGDTIELWLKGLSLGSPAYNNEFYVCGTEHELSLQEAITSGDVGVADAFAATNSTP